MALLNANFMGLYALNASGTSPYAIGVGANLSAAETDAWTNLGSQTGYAILVDSDDDVIQTGSQPAIVQMVNSTTSSAQTLNLLAAATSTSLDLNNAQTEVVARDGACGSETFLVSGAQDWSLQADGLIQTGSVAGYGAMTLMDTARKGQYVLVRFVVNNEAMDSATDNDENVSYIGQALVENVNISGGFDDISTYSVTLNGYGKLYKYSA
jgi:predicted secreted protein